MLKKFLPMSLFTTGLLIFLALFLFYAGKTYLLLANKPSLPKLGPGNFDSTQLQGHFHGKTYSVPPRAKPELSYARENNDILGSSKTNDDDKRIEVDLTHQKLKAYEGSKKKFEFLVSTGKWYPTPTGEYRVWYKTASTLMTGGSKAWGTYYYLPNVPYTMFFYQGFGLHGTYWHDNFGHPMSHGCINMRIEDAEKLFYWVNPKLPEGKNSTTASDDNKGTRVIIYGEAPKE